VCVPVLLIRLVFRTGPSAYAFLGRSTVTLTVGVGQSKSWKLVTAIETPFLGTRHRWFGGIRGLLRWAGFPGTFGGSQPDVAVSADDEEWHHFLVAVHGTFGSNPFAVKDLVGQLGSYGGIDSAMLPGDLAEGWSRVRDGNDASFRKSLGWWLKNRTGRYAAGWSVASAGEDPYTKVARYEVRPPPWGH
jgi:hypothetical protein